MSQTKTRFGIVIAASAVTASSYAASMVSVNYLLQGTTCPTCGIFDPTRLSAADQDTNSITGNVSLKDTLGSSAPGIDYSVDAEATAGFGNLHAFVDGTALANTGVNSEGSGNAIANALASWDDSLLIGVPSRSNNARITFHTSLMVDGELLASASASPAELEVIIPCTPTGICVHQSMSGGSAGVTVSASVNNRFGVTASGLRFEDSTGFDEENDLPAVIPFDFTVFNNSTSHAHVELSVSGGVSAKGGELAGDSADATFNADFHETLTWGGISSVTDADTGELITDWSITSESGFDYSKPYTVPEPESLVLAALAALGGFQIKRRHRRGRKGVRTTSVRLKDCF